MIFLNNFLLFFVVLVLSVTQHFNWLTIFGIKPDLILAFLIASSFFIDDFIFYLFLVILSYFLLKLEPRLDLSVLVLSGLLILSFWLRKILPWQLLFNLTFLILSISTIFYLIISPYFIINNPALFIGEILYNLVLGLVFFWVLK